MSDDISDVTVTELPPVDPLPEQNVVDALKKLSRAETVAEKLEAVKGISVTTAVSRKFLAEKGFLLDCVPLVTVALQADDDVSLEKVADVLAEVLKDETARTMAGDSNLQDLLGKLLARSHVGTKVNALRCLGNLAFDNDGNRQRIVVKAKLLQPVLDLMAHADNDVIRAASNAAFNILLTEDEKLRDAALDADLVGKTLARIRQSRDLAVLKAVSNLLYSFFDSDRAIREFLQKKGLEDVIELCKCEDTLIAESSIGSLTLLAEIEKLRRPLYEQGLVDFLFGLVDSDKTTLVMKRSSAKTIGVALADDKNMNSVFEDKKLAVFAQWLSNSDPEIRAYAALCITNIARTDAHCLQVLRSGLVDHLAGMILSTDVKEQNCSINAFRNLCISVEGKTILGQKGVIEKLVKVFDGENSAAKFTSAIIIKNLLLKHSDNAQKLAAADGFAALTKMFESTTHDGMRCETARIFVNIVRLKNAELTKKVLENDAITLVLELLKSEHAILRAEAYETYKSLVVVASEGDSGSKYKSAILKALLELVPAHIKDDSEPVQLAAIDLLATLLPESSEVVDGEHVGALKDALKQLTGANVKPKAVSLVQKL